MRSDSIDSERIAALVESLRSHSPYLVVALLDEDAAALDESYEYISR